MVVNREMQNGEESEENAESVCEREKTEKAMALPLSRKQQKLLG